MVLVILLVLALFVLQTLLPGRFRARPAGSPPDLIESMGNRDHMAPLTVVGRRAERALANMHEALPVFLALALMNLMLGPGAGAVTGAWIFLAARVLYVPLYVGGVPYVRSIVWFASWVGLVMMLLPLLDRV
jgi:uncharacterized MAPEG superfamily protein